MEKRKKSRKNMQSEYKEVPSGLAFTASGIKGKGDEENSCGYNRNVLNAADPMTAS